MPGMRSHLPVALLLLWLPREYLNSALSVTVFVLLLFSTTTTREKYLGAQLLCLGAFGELGPWHMGREPL